MTYIMYMYGICITYTSFSDPLVLQGFKEEINTGCIGNTCVLHGFSGQLLDSTQKALFTLGQDIPGIYKVYTMYIPDTYHTKVICEPA
jgi:hypothetical protein